MSEPLGDLSRALLMELADETQTVQRIVRRALPNIEREARAAAIPPDAVLVTEEGLAEGLKVVTRGTWSTPTRRHPDAQAAQDERWLRDTAAAILAALRANP